MKKVTRISIVLSVLILCFHQPLVPVSGETSWSQTYGGADDDRAYVVIQTTDNGFMLAGIIEKWNTNSFGEGYLIGADIWLVKTDAKGMIQWTQTYSNAQNFDLIQTADGGFALTGTKNFWLMKTDATGRAEWNQTYGYIRQEKVRALVQTTDGGFALAGETWSKDKTCRLWLVKTDSLGLLQWDQIYEGLEEFLVFDLIQTRDECFVLTGTTPLFGRAEIFLIKIDAKGEVQWNQTYGGANTDAAYSVLQTLDGGFALAGYTRSFGAGSIDMWLVRTDTNGTIQWNQTYGGSERDTASMVIQTTDGGFALAGYTNSYGAGDYDSWLVKTDAKGVVQWNQTYGGTGEDYAYSLIRATDGGFALAGATSSYGAGYFDFWLLKIDDTGSPPIMLEILGLPIQLFSPFVLLYILPMLSGSTIGLITASIAYPYCKRRWLQNP
ncbi:MAG: hypothetical protein ACFFBD_10690 [Candidatus Hodarchaeota archaeon]